MPPEERFALWTEVSSQVFQRLVVHQTLDRPFSARLMRYRLGPLSVDHMISDATTVERRAAMIRGGDPEWIEVMLQMRGQCAVSQADRASVVAPGQFCSWDSSRPYTIQTKGPYEVLMVHCPALLLRPHVDRLRRRTAQCVDGGAGVGALVSQYLVGLLRGLDDDAIGETSRSHLAEGLLDLVRALYFSAEPAATPQARGSDVLRAQIRAYIDAHLADPGLCPDAIARAHFISRSYLDRLFEAEDSSVQETIRAKRLDRSRRDLIDRTLMSESVFEIASRWGFRSASHFSRSFRAAYGQSPSDFRRSVLG
ncbi:MAG TPA: helix-turn-helix domain-containing protein [Solirubrobacteraceae bacterium]|nr:helix-turn-helix domain-containing protein [Solirubrobacteraceae bacterium]